MNRRSKTLLITGFITIAVTGIILGLCIKDWSGITPLAVMMILWAEIALIDGLMMVEKIAEQTEQVILRSSSVVVLPLYSVTAIALSVIFMAGFRNARTAFIVLQLIIMAITAILLTVFFSISKSVKHSNEAAMDVKSFKRGKI